MSCCSLDSPLWRLELAAQVRGALAGSKTASSRSTLRCMAPFVGRTRELAALAAAADAARRLALLGASRSSASASAFPDSVTHVLAADDFVMVELSGLSRDEGVALAQSLAPELVDAEAVALWRRAEGSPFWLEALARSGGAEADAAQLVTARLGGSADAASLLALL